MRLKGLSLLGLLLLCAPAQAAEAVRVAGEVREVGGAPVAVPGSSSLGSASSLTGSLSAPSLSGALPSLPGPQVQVSASLQPPAAPLSAAPAAVAPSLPILAPVGQAKAPAAVLQENAAEVQKSLAEPGAGPAGEEKASAVSGSVFDNKKRGPAVAAPEGPSVLAEPGEAGPALRPGLAKAAVPIQSIVESAAGRRFGGVSIHQEQEGNLTAQDARDSSGSVFEYYRPVEMRPDLAAQALAGMGRFDRFVYQFHRLTRPFRGQSPWNVWDDMPLDAKLRYVSLLDAAVMAERGKDEVWEGPLFKLLTRSPRAPPYVAEHPHLEEPRLFRGEHPFARYLEPEIVTDREHPAATAREAIARTKIIIADTGHAGTHYHVFLRAEPAALQRQMASLQSTLQLLNDMLFADAAAKSYDNLFHPFLLPWHQGRSERVRKLVDEAGASASRPDHRDPDNEKFAFVAFRYWGLEEGRMVVSFELRGANMPWKSARRSGGTGYDTDVPKPERDYGEVERYLTFLVLYADRLVRGAAPAVPEPALRLDLAAAEQAVAKRAQEKGMGPDDYLGLEGFSRLMFSKSVNQPQAREDRAGMVHSSLLLPFAAGGSFGPKTQAHLAHLTDVFLEQSVRLKAMSRGGREVPDASLRNVKYMFWEAYGGWARSLLAQDQARFEELFRALAP